LKVVNQFINQCSIDSVRLNCHEALCAELLMLIFEMPSLRGAKRRGNPVFNFEPNCGGEWIAALRSQ
jgi:hypothetical protein